MRDVVLQVDAIFCAKSKMTRLQFERMWMRSWCVLWNRQTGMCDR